MKLLRLCLICATLSINFLVSSVSIAVSPEEISVINAVDWQPLLTLNEYANRTWQGAIDCYQGDKSEATQAYWSKSITCLEVNDSIEEFRNLVRSYLGRVKVPELDDAVAKFCSDQFNTELQLCRNYGQRLLSTLELDFSNMFISFGTVVAFYGEEETRDGKKLKNFFEEMRKVKSPEVHPLTLQVLLELTAEGYLYPKTDCPRFYCQEDLQSDEAFLVYRATKFMMEGWDKPLPESKKTLERAKPYRVSQAALRWLLLIASTQDIGQNFGLSPEKSAKLIFTFAWYKLHQSATNVNTNMADKMAYLIQAFNSELLPEASPWRSPDYLSVRIKDLEAAKSWARP